MAGGRRVRWFVVTAGALTAFAACAGAAGSRQPGADGDPQADAPADVSADDETDAVDAEAVGAAPIVTACAGAAALCDRRYDEVSFVCTHNGMSSREAGWAAPNQTYGLRRQLDDGVAGFMLDIHRDDRDNGIKFCHGWCYAGSTPLVDGLAVFAEHLAARPDAVLTFVLENYVPAADLAAAFEAAGLMPYVHAQDADAPWPTLRQMIAAGRRLVVFTDRGGDTYPWLMNAWRHTFQNPYAATKPSELACAVDRGRSSNPIFVYNHFLTAPLPAPRFAEQVNRDPFLRDTVFACRDKLQRRPNFVTVDFYDIGDVFAVVRALNGLQGE